MMFMGHGATARAIEQEQPVLLPMRGLPKLRMGVSMTASGRAAASMARASTSAQSSSNTKDTMCLKCGGSQLGNLESGKQIVHLKLPV